MLFHFVYSDQRPASHVAVDLSMKIFNTKTKVLLGLTDVNGWLDAPAWKLATPAPVVVRRGTVQLYEGPAKPATLAQRDLVTVIGYDAWPPALRGLRAALQSGPLGASMRAVAQRVLAGLDASSFLGALLERPIEHPCVKWPNQPGDLADNPTISMGAILAALSISYRHVLDAGLAKASTGHPYEAERNQLAAIESAIGGILNRIMALNRSGYVLRWKQWGATAPLGYSYLKENWQAEPSLDEYSGLLMGLRWAQMMIGTPFPAGQALGQQASGLLAQISRYLQGTEGWLVNPLGALTVRGPHLVVYAFALQFILNGFRNKKPAALSARVKKFIETSAQQLKKLKADPKSDPDLVKHYADTLKPFIEVTEHNWIVAIVNKMLGEPLDMDDAGVWGIMTTGLATGVDPGGYNISIYDRFSLAAFNEQVNASWLARSFRATELDRAGAQLLTEACRVWFGDQRYIKAPVSNSLTDRIAKIFKSNVDALLPSGTNPSLGYGHCEGFLFAWALLCHTVGVDPGIDWAAHVHFRLPACDGHEIAQAAPHGAHP